MRILSIPWAQRSHYAHLVPLAWALRAAGHEVRIAAQPAIADAVARTGMVWSEIGAGYDPASATPAEALAPLVRTAAATAGDLGRLVRSWRPDLVVCDPYVLAGPIAAGIAGVPLVHHLCGPCVQRRTGVIPGSGRPVALWPDELREVYDRAGVEPVGEPAAGAVDTCPPALQYPGLPGRIPMRHVPYDGSGEAPDWLLVPPARPRVAVTWGILSHNTLGALAGLDVEMVVTVGAAERALLGEPPAGVRVVRDLPLHLLLPTCAAIVHQGGSGTLLTAAAAGVPQAVVPVLPGHLVGAGQLDRAGAGVMLDSAEAPAEAIRAAVVRILGDDCRGAAARLRDEVAACPSPAEVVGTLVALAEAV